MAKVEISAAPSTRTRVASYRRKQTLADAGRRRPCDVLNPDWRNTIAAVLLTSPESWAAAAQKPSLSDPEDRGGLPEFYSPAISCCKRVARKTHFALRLEHVIELN
jgi:hypothetical protein